jgi:NADPH2:quinone reductase
MMKAIRVHEIGGPEVMRLEEVPDPQPMAGQVLVRIHAVGVNPFDTYMRAGAYSIKPVLPYTPGDDAAGVVEVIGEGVKRVTAGDRVYTARTVSGAYAEAAVCDEAQVHRLPKNVSFAQGAAVNVPYATAYRALFQHAHALPGETVLVHGATGGVGIAGTQLARAAGLTVIGTGGTEQGRQLVKEQGAHHVIDHHAPDYLEEIKELTNGVGVNVVLEMLANVNLGKDLGILAKSGRIVVIGSRGTVEIDPRAAMTRDASIHAMSVWNASAKELASIHAALGAGMENGTLRPVVGKEMPLADAPRAHKEVIESNAYGKIVLTP